MNSITGKPVHGIGGESLYKQINNKINQPPETKPNDPKVKINQAEKTKADPAKAVLTTHEVNTLNALFGEGKDNMLSNYGRSKIQNVQSGYLLDVKG